MCTTEMPNKKVTNKIIFCLFWLFLSRSTSWGRLWTMLMLLSRSWNVGRQWRKGHSKQSLLIPCIRKQWSSLGEWHFDAKAVTSHLDLDMCINTNCCFLRYAMKLKSHSGPGARQEDKQLAVLWYVCHHLICLSHIYHHTEGRALWGWFCAMSDSCPQFPMPGPPLLADVSLEEGSRAEILQSAAGLF